MRSATAHLEGWERMVLEYRDLEWDHGFIGGVEVVLEYIDVDGKLEHFGVCMIYEGSTSNDSEFTSLLLPAIVLSAPGENALLWVLFFYLMRSVVDVQC